MIADPGTGWVFRRNTWQPVPAVTYTQTELAITWQDSSDQILTALTDYPGGGGSYSQTFSQATDYTISATGTTSGGGQVHASGVNLPVSPVGPPVFTVVAPADGATVGLGPNGGPVTVQLSSGTDQFYPFSVSIAHDGAITTGQYSGTSYSSTITLTPTPVGSRSISITCTDPANQSSTQTRSLVGTDGAPPSMTLDPFDGNVTATSLPYVFALAGKTSGASSGVTGVSYAFTNGPSGSAQDTSAAGDWSTWGAQISLPTTGRFDFTVTATDSRGGTGSASASITVHL
ncbi:hypothetical protein QMK19_31825 [Streptomyces sp. H10-C2]|uniref:hypothetical protein n=1 Tax=unclassified Streptomyces TaxID=2593676 RepID=UPI0024BAF71D|nr:MULTISPECIES: hypothetical protein [unclassified Streptomyces]MDJ0345132.1 hypothetical protein [Streptomyces sp. PH10-H1]MDJ0374100.1 hypothetical protein [Streptomyces sp. H10-C2]